VLTIKHCTHTGISSDTEQPLVLAACAWLGIDPRGWPDAVMSAARQRPNILSRVHSDYMWGYTVPMLVAVPAEVLAPAGALDLIKKHSGGEGMTELGADWVLVTPPDGGDAYYWHRPSSVTQYECPWSAQIVRIEPSSVETVLQAFDAISAELGVDIADNYALMYTDQPLPENDLLATHFPERYDDGVDGSQSNACFFCHLEDREASRQTTLEMNLQMIRVISRFKALYATPAPLELELAYTQCNSAYARALCVLTTLSSRCCPTAECVCVQRQAGKRLYGRVNIDAPRRTREGCDAD
jgi:hypothetical protein